MKIKKLLKIVLVAPSYIVVFDNGNNRRIFIENTSEYSIGGFYEEISYSPIIEKQESVIMEEQEENISILKEIENGD